MGVRRGDILANYQWLNTICSEWPKEYVEIGRYLILNREEKDVFEFAEPEVQFKTILFPLLILGDNKSIGVIFFLPP